MGTGMTCMIWCDECCGENWEDVSRWVDEGRASTRSGTLKIATACRSCDAPLPVGSSVEAITIHGGGKYCPWEDEFLAAETGWERIDGGAERPGRES